MSDLKAFAQSTYNPLRGYLKCQKELVPFNVLLAIFSITYLAR